MPYVLDRLSNHRQLKALIASREKMLEKYRQLIGEFPCDRKEGNAFQRKLASMQATVSSTERILQRLEESLVCFSDFAMKVEYQTRKQASERLESSNRLA